MAVFVRVDASQGTVETFQRFAKKLLVRNGRNVFSERMEDCSGTVFLKTPSPRRSRQDGMMSFFALLISMLRTDRSFKVFISSTSNDLRDYRNAAIEICNRLGLVPVAMEVFPSMGLGATAASLVKLDAADVYVGIFAHRYGFVEAGHESSVTELEFDHAGRRGLERLSFLVQETYPWPPDFVDDDHGRLVDLKKRIRAAMVVSEFTTTDDFKVKLFHALMEWRERQEEASPEARFNTGAIGYDQARAASLAYLRSAFEDGSRAKVELGQTINVLEREGGHVVERRHALEALESWWSGWPAAHRPFVLLGEEGIGKTWAFASWLARRLVASEPTLPLTLFLPSWAVGSFRALDLIADALATCTGVREAGFWPQRAEAFVQRSLMTPPALLLVLDGLNEQPRFDWRALLESLQVSPWKDQVAVRTFLARPLPPQHPWNPPAPPPGSLAVNLPDGRSLLLFRDGYLGSPNDLWIAELDRNGRQAGPSLYTGILLPPDEDSRALSARIAGDKIEVLDAAGRKLAAFDPAVAAQDSDGDGLPDLAEKRLRLDPAKVDTDGDGLADADDPAPNARLREPVTEDQEIAAAVFRHLFLLEGEDRRPEIAVVVSDAALEWRGRGDLTITLDAREAGRFLEETAGGGVPLLSFQRGEPPVISPIGGDPPGGGAPPVQPDEAIYTVTIDRGPLHPKVIYRAVARNLNAAQPSQPPLWAVRDLRTASIGHGHPED